jgi:predicted ribosomally synthesized peptide with SipW-like signal peptide
MKKFVLKFIALGLILCLNSAAISAVSDTFASFSDIETSGNNTFTAGAIDMTLRSDQSNFVTGSDSMSPGEQVERDIYVGKTSISLPVKHNIDFEFVSGDIDLCNQLDLEIRYNHYFGPLSGGDAHKDERLIYDGKLSSLVDHTHVDLEIPYLGDQFDIDPIDGTEQWFSYNIILPNGTDDSFQGKICDFNFIYEAWHIDILDSLSGGFVDEEEINNIIKTEYWNPQVVLNEFLPNSDSFPEFVEIFNQTNLAIELSEFHIETNGNVIPINPTTTSLFSGGATQIPANGWLVVATGGDLINDVAGTINLYNQNNIIVDSYSYNDGAIPVDKTYARIPDGANNWVDPIPTPGTPNKLDVEIQIFSSNPIIIVESIEIDIEPIEPVVITTADVKIIEGIEELVEQPILDIIEEIVEVVLEELIIEPVVEEETNIQPIIEEKTIEETQEEIIVEEAKDAEVVDAEIELVENEIEVAEAIEELLVVEIDKPISIEEPLNQEVELTEIILDVETITAADLDEDPIQEALNEPVNEDDEITI